MNSSIVTTRPGRLSKVIKAPFVLGSLIATALMTIGMFVLHSLFSIPYKFFLVIPVLVLAGLMIDSRFRGVPISFGMKVLSCLIFYPLCTYRRWTKINENLYLGALPLQRHLQRLIEKEKISCVLSITEKFELETGGLFFQPVSPQLWKDKGIEHKMIEVQDCTTPLEEHIDEAVDFIDKQIRNGKKVYVHCQAGIERSATVVAAYLLQTGATLDIEETIFHLKRLRPQVVFSKGNRELLKKWQERLLQSSSGLKWLYERCSKYIQKVRDALKR